ncbi:MAG TPA: hypothetical protein VG076_18800 [Acidimicrobiales bacterium]|nr:hypothetical protein [Acidimicrobiales bacterium]
MRMTSRTFYGGAALSVVLAAGLILAACGGSATKTNAAPVAATSPTTAPPSTSAAPGPVIMTKTDPKLGTILADSKGLTLYTLTVNGKAVDCTGACAAVWPPLTAAADSTPTGGPGVGTLGTASSSDGTQLVTFGGLPLYRFSQDQDAGDAYGEGISSFGGVWHVVKVGQTAGVAPTTAPTPAAAKRAAPTTPSTPAKSMTPVPARAAAPASTTPATAAPTPVMTMHRSPPTSGAGMGLGY